MDAAMYPDPFRPARRLALPVVLGLASLVATCGAQAPDSTALPVSTALPDSAAAPDSTAAPVSTAVPDSAAAPDSTAALAAPEAPAAPAHRAGGPLADEITRWTEYLAADTASDDNSVQVRRAAEPALAQARASLERGRRLHALLRLGAARALLGGLAYTREHPTAAISIDLLETEWRRAGPELLADWPAAATRSLPGIRPAAIRAMAEAAIPAVQVSYDASFEYGRATAADAGLFYLGEAVAQRQFVTLCRSASEPTAAPEPAFRSIAPEIEALQGEMLGLYRPPLSIDRHPEFIGASAALKEARELNAAGLVRGALLRYLQATLRFQALLEHPPAFDSVATPARLAALETLMEIVGYRDQSAGTARASVDHSLGRLFLEAARADLEDTSATATHATAAAIAEVVLPRYLAALEPAKAVPPARAAQVTVTLVRWPYT
jgi:hypothetical protein